MQRRKDRATGGKRLFDITTDTDDDDEKIYTNSIPVPGTYTSEWDYFTLGGNNTFKVGTGISLTYAYKENYAWRLFLDYDYTRKTYTMSYNPAMFILDAVDMGLPGISTPLRELFSPAEQSEFVESHSIKKNRHTFILGGSFVISF